MNYVGDIFLYVVEKGFVGEICMLVKISNIDKLYTGGILFIPDLAVEKVSHVFRAAFYS